MTSSYRRSGPSEGGAPAAHGRRAASPSSAARDRAPRPLRRRAPGRVSKGFAVLAASGAFALMAITAIAPPPPARAVSKLDVYIQTHAQSMTVSSNASIDSIDRDGYTATAGLQTLSNRATNRDWATMVLMLGKWPMSDNNITVITRWMRQENGPNNWWNRNNPLNNGWGSGGHAGTGSYPNLVVAAQNAAAALHKNPGYSAIIAALARSAPMDVTASAIWASPWSTSHYANGSHWSTAPVDSFVAPASAWG